MASLNPLARIIGKGATLSVGGTAVVGLTDVAQPKQAVGKVDSTEYDDTLEQDIPGWLNAGGVAFKFNYIGLQWDRMNALLGVEGTAFILTLSNGATWSWTGWLDMLGGPVPIKGMVTCDCSCVLTTVPTRTGS